MGGLFGGEKPKAPKPMAPPAMPTEISPEVIRKGEDRRRKMLAALGRRGTILTGALGEPTVGKATLGAG